VDLVFNVVPVRKHMLLTKRTLISPQQVELRAMANRSRLPQSFSGILVLFLFLDMKSFFIVPAQSLVVFYDLLGVVFVFLLVMFLLDMLFSSVLSANFVTAEHRYHMHMKISLLMMALCCLTV